MFAHVHRLYIHVHALNILSVNQVSDERLQDLWSSGLLSPFRCVDSTLQAVETFRPVLHCGACLVRGHFKHVDYS